MTTIGLTSTERARGPAGFLTHERATAGTRNVAFVYEIARAEVTKGEGWGTGTAMICEMIDDCSAWADEYHLITKDVVGGGREGVV